MTTFAEAAAGRYVVAILDRSLSRVAEVSEFSKFQAFARFNQQGSFMLTLPTDSLAGAEVVLGGGLVVFRDGTPFFSGPFRRIDRTFDGERDDLTVAGPSHDFWMDARWAQPSLPPYNAAAYDVRTGDAETVIKAYVNINCGPSAPTAARRIPGLQVAYDQSRGTTVTGRARFQPLGDLLRLLAAAGGDMGWQVLFDDDGVILFDCYEPRDLTATVAFSLELGNLIGGNHVISIADANYVNVAGGGEGTLRTFQEQGDATSIADVGRIEGFVDRRDTTDAGELAQEATAQLAETASRFTLKFTPIDTPGAAFGADYGLGDQVTVLIDEEPITQIVREVQVTVDGDGEVVEPILATPGANPEPELFTRLRKSRSRLLDLERR